jgi:general secretion pathway protein I
VVRRELPLRRGKGAGFTLLEVMVAMAIIAIALTAVLGSQSQGVSLASEAKFSTTAALLAQDKLAQLELEKPDDLVGDSGDFGEDFPGYVWQVTVRDMGFEIEEAASDYVKKIELEISFGGDKRYRYRLTLYRFFPKTK